MNGGAVAALVAAGVLAMGDWISRARHQQVLEFVCKPGTMVGLFAMAVALHPATGLTTRRDWFVAAVCLSLVGDVLLMLPKENFIGGLSAFLVAHLCYIAGFLSHPPSWTAELVKLAVVLIVLAPVARRILRTRALADEPPLRGAVALYIVVIAVMVATAVASGRPVAGAGAALFALSDSMIAWDRFVRPFRAASVAIMVTYHLGQAGLVLSLLAT